MPVPPNLIIFDCDGVLVDSEVVAGRNVSECLTALGIQVPVAEVISRYTGVSDKMMCEDLRSRFGELIPPNFSEALGGKIMQRFNTDLKPITGVHRLLQELPHQFCVASSSTPERIKHALAITGLIDFL